MAGHSKWNNIKHKKAAQDSKKGKAFSELAKLIRIAVKEGKSGDPGANPTLRTLMDKARSINMPKENISRAVDRGLGVGKGGRIEEVMYEGYGPGGVGILVVSHTDNRQRTGGEVRFVFDKHGGSLASPGAAAYLFDRQGDDFVAKMPMILDDNTSLQLNELVEALDALDDVEEVITTVAQSVGDE